MELELTPAQIAEIPTTIAVMMVSTPLSSAAFRAITKGMASKPIVTKMAQYDLIGIDSPGRQSISRHAEARQVLPSSKTSQNSRIRTGPVEKVDLRTKCCNASLETAHSLVPAVDFFNTPDRLIAQILESHTLN